MSMLSDLFSPAEHSMMPSAAFVRDCVSLDQPACDNQERTLP